VINRRLFDLPRPVWLLGWVSLFTDMASEMVYPLLPLFLSRTLGAGAMSLGIIEGVAEAANSALKVASGWLADRTRLPKRLVLAGYALSSVARPLMALAASWTHVLAIRLGDRLGKGIRGAPRDAMLAEFSPEGARGRVYGFHRAMDHAGAVVGPLLAAAFLFVYPDDYRTLFTLTLVPGAIVILILLRVPNPPHPTASVPRTPSVSAPHPTASVPRTPSVSPPPPTASVPRTPSVSPPHPLRSSRPFRRAMIVILLFSLGNASDAFILLRLSELGVAAFWIPLLWSALHVVKMGSSLAGGALSDRFGRRRLIALGWLSYAAVYAGFALTASPGTTIALFLAYGLYFGLTEGVEKAWVADLAPAGARGTAFGIYNGMLGVGALLASLLFGFIWTRVSPEAAFMTGAGLAIGATLLIYFWFSHAEDPGHER
jgi:MFS family permease